MDQTPDWIMEVDKELEEMEKIPKQERPEKKQEEKIEKPIYKVPARIRGNFPNSDYAPCKVSFGPYHHGDESYKKTEKIKQKVLLHSLKRSNKKIKDYVKPFTGDVLKKLRDAYNELGQDWQQDMNFQKLMIYDGCFLLEILHSVNYSSYGDASDNPVRDIDGNGIMPPGLMEDYRRDMLLVENQLPMLVLEKLLAAQGEKSWKFIPDKIQEVSNQIQEVSKQEYLNGHILKFIFPRVNIKIPPKKCSHVLDLYRHSLLSLELEEESTVQCLWRIANFGDMKKSPSIIISVLAWPSLFLLGPVLWVTLALVDMTLIFPLKLLIYILKTPPATEFPIDIPSATDLDKAGIVFTSRTKGLRDISYGRRALRLPQIYVDWATKSTLLNIIAFEQCYKYANREVSSYIYFMHCLIRCPDDVNLLQSRRALVFKPTTEIVELFNSLTVGVLQDPDSFVVSRYRDMSARLTNSYYSMSNPWQKDLWQTYLRSPWAIVSLFAAFLVFALTSLQTVYTVLGFYKSE